MARKVTIYESDGDVIETTVSDDSTAAAYERLPFQVGTVARVDVTDADQPTPPPTREEPVMGWKQDRAEIKRLMAARPDPNGSHGDESQEAQAINAELDRKLREQPIWRRARALYED